MHQTTDNKEKLIRTALNLFAERGFRGTSIRDIANTMGMSISNIYHYFGNKEGLLKAILQYSCDLLLENLRGIVHREIDPLDRFALLVKTHIHLSNEWRKEAKIFFLDEEHLSPEGNRINAMYQREVLEIYRRELRNLQALGHVHARSISILAFNILGVINWHLRWYRPDGQLTLDEVSEEIVSFVLHGVMGNGERGTAPKPHT